jgi:hypothetical protein
MAQCSQMTWEIIYTASLDRTTGSIEESVSMREDLLIKQLYLRTNSHTSKGNRHSASLRGSQSKYSAFCWVFHPAPRHFTEKIE